MQEIDCLLAQLGVEPDDVDIYFDLADAYDREGNLPEAKSILTCLLQKPLSLEDWGHAKRWLGWIYYRENDFNTTLQIAEELLEADLDDLQTGYAHHLMGLCLMEKYYYTEQAVLSKRYLDEAIHSFEQAAELVENEEEEQAEILWRWGTALRLQSRFDKAIEVLNSALGMATAESRIAGMCHAQLGRAYFEGPQEYEKTVYHLEAAARILRDDDPGYHLAWVYSTLSRAYVWLQQYEKALTNAQRSLETVNRDEEGWKSKLANAHQVCGDVHYYSELDLSLAQKHYRACLKLLNEGELTERAQTMLKFADIDRMKGKHKRALKGFKEVLSLNASGIDYGALYLVMGECYAKSKNFTAAVEAYQAAIEHSGGDQDALANALLHLGHSLFELKRYGEAADTYREGLKYVDPKAPERSEMMKYLMASNELKSR